MNVVQANDLQFGIPGHGHGDKANCVAMGLNGGYGFRSRVINFADRISQSVGDVSLLLLLASIIFILGLFMFERYDVR